MAQWQRTCLPMEETWVRSLGWENPLENAVTVHSSTLAWRIPWTEEPGGLQSMGSQRVKHDLATKQKQQYSIMENYLKMKIICTLYAYMYN